MQKKQNHKNILEIRDVIKSYEDIGENLNIPVELGISENSSTLEIVGNSSLSLELQEAIMSRKINFILNRILYFMN